MRQLMKIACITITLATTAPLAAQGQVQGQQSAQSQTPPFQNVAQLCRMREREIVSLNLQILGRVNSAEREKNQAKRNQLLQPLPELRNNLTRTESSWERMGCAHIVYYIAR